MKVTSKYLRACVCNMDKIKQVLVFGACSLLLSSVIATAKKTVQQTSGLSNAPAPAALTSQANHFQSSRQSTSDVSAQASSASSLYANPGYPSIQPNIYHSVIDQTINPASTVSTAQTSAATIDGDLSTAAGHHHGHAHGKYYEYRAVPEKKTWKYGYKRGNHKHTIMRHEHGKAGKHPHFKTKVKWHDKKSKGKGIHLWDYNHHDKKHYGHHG